MTIEPVLDRPALVDWYVRNRARTARLFSLLSDEAYYSKPIALRHPIVFYEGHLPAFSLNKLVKEGLGKPGIDEELERLFARGIDPHEGAPAGSTTGGWPDRSRVLEFAAAADDRVVEALQRGDIEQPSHPFLDRAQAAFAILEHEVMHQETLLYMWHRLPHDQKQRPGDYGVVRESASVPNEELFVAPGRARLGVAPGSIAFGWDNEFPSTWVDVPAFAVDRLNVTNGDFLAFVDAGGYAQAQWWTLDDWAWVRHEQIAHPPFWSKAGDEWMWRGMFETLPLPMQWPVYVSQAEASAYTRWRGRRLPTEAEYQRAAYGAPGQEVLEHPWGDAAPDATRGVFDFASWEPEPVGTHPRGQSAWGIEDLVGNGWEWTSTVFSGFPGFQPMAAYPEYSADFFDGQHFVMKGASPATARELLRPSFRNWFRPRYPYVYATFRCVREQP